MTEWWVVLGASAITALAALGGSVVALFFEGRRERRRWLRDRRAEIYVEILRAHGRSLLNTAALQAHDPGTTPLDRAQELVKRVESDTRGLMDTITTLQVFGSKKVAKLADDLGRAISREAVPDQATLNPKWNALAEAIRADLGVPD
jgi:hypothetical protein